MEKIYDESQQQVRQQKKRKKVRVDGVSMLCFAVAAFAIVSLIAVGFSGTSYALPESVEELPNSFTAAEDDTNYMTDNIMNQEVDYHYTQSGSIPLICLERDVDFATGSEYTESGSTVSSDSGLLYLLSHLSPNVSFTYPSDFTKYGSDTKYSDFWISQMAVWTYLDGTTNNVVTYSDGNTIGTKSSQVNYVMVGQDVPASGDPASGKYFGYLASTGKTIFSTVTTDNGLTIDQLIAKAKEKKSLSYDINISSDGTLFEDDNKKYYFSGPYTVSTTISDDEVGEFVSYTVKLDNAPDGTIVTDKDGVSLTANSDGTFTSTDPTTQFYVRVTKDKVSASTDISVTVNGTFKMFEGNEYTVSGKEAQTVTAVKFVNKTLSKSTSFTVAPAPDTGLSAGVTVYFIGLIVLLCGVGIIYANAKPSTQN